MAITILAEKLIKYRERHKKIKMYEGVNKATMLIQRAAIYNMKKDSLIQALLLIAEGYNSQEVIDDVVTDRHLEGWLKSRGAEYKMVTKL